jgi:hypothetical protein
MNKLRLCWQAFRADLLYWLCLAWCAFVLFLWLVGEGFIR